MCNTFNWCANEANLVSAKFPHISDANQSLQQFSAQTYDNHEQCDLKVVNQNC